MRIILLSATTLLLALIYGAAMANTLTWQDNSSVEDGFIIEMLNKGAWQEVARVGANVTTYTDTRTEGVYRVKAFIAGDPAATPPIAEVTSAPSNTGAKLNSPVIMNVK